MNSIEGNVSFQCACGRRLRGVPLSDVATYVVRRSCKCGKRWQAVIRPAVAIKQGLASVCELVELQ